MRAPSNFLLLLGLGVVPGLVSAAISLDGLATDSPFMLKHAENAAPAVTEGAAVEFRGMIATKDGVFFGLYDRTKNTGAWVRQNEAGNDFNVKAYDAANDTVSIEYQGQRFTLPLSSAKITSAAAPVAVSPQPGGGNAVNVTAQPAARVQDQQRLESVAAEVRRRRALRQSATGGAPAPAATNGARQ